MYTIREFNFTAKTINNIGEFQEFSTKREALKYLRSKILEE